MCTLTVVPLPDSRVRLAFNRDEQRTRPPSLPPTKKKMGGRDAILPIDPVSGGTWLAVNDAGLALALLNVNPAAGSTETTLSKSRGHIIPSLLDCSSPAHALQVVESAFVYTDYAPFRLVMIGSGIVADVQWNGRQAMVMNRLLGGAPILFTSSGLGDHLVEDVRRELFTELFDRPADEWESIQDAFHRHRWPDRSHLSVNMSRADARTVSFCRINIRKLGATFTYHADAPDREADDHVMELAFSNSGAS